MPYAPSWPEKQRPLSISALKPQPSNGSAEGDAETPEVITATPEQLPILLTQAKQNGADFAIADTAPHSNRAAVVAADLADLVFIPCRPSAFDVAAIGTTLNLFKLNKAMDRAAILVNAVPSRGAI